ncbi:unnamed protein product, partial [Cyprideis torosa]
MVPLCLGQNAARYAKQMVVVVARRDLARKRAKQNLAFINHADPSDFPSEKAIKLSQTYYNTANLAQIEEAQKMGILDGVTTNPSLMAKENIVGDDAVIKHYKDICNIVDGDVNAEVISTDFEGMKKEGDSFAALDPKIVVKIPMTLEGIMAAKYFSSKGIKTN